MTDTLAILAGTTPGDHACWLPLDATGQAVGTVQQGPLGAAAGMAAERRVVVFVPAEQMILTELTVPGLRGARLRQAVPFALEDLVATDIERLHCANGDPDPDGQVAVAALERALMDEWLAALRTAGLEPSALVPDCLGLPWQDGETSVAITADRALMRDGPAHGFTCEPVMLDAMLAAHADSLPATRLAAAPDAAVPAALAATPVTPLRNGLLPWLAPQALAPALNLLQGDYAPKRRRGVADLGPWRLPAGLAAAALAVALLGWSIEYRTLASENRALQARINATFQRAVPDEPMQNPRVQIERRLAAAAGGGELLQMLSVVGDGLAGVPGVELSAVSYRGGMLELTVAARRAEQLDRLRDRLAANGRFTASIESASSRGDSVEGRVQLRSAGG